MTTEHTLHPQRTIRSFVKRCSRTTPGQLRALELLWPKYGIDDLGSLSCLTSLFNRSAPCIIDVGFGSGDSLIALAQHFPDHNIIGIDVHEPGIGQTLKQIEEKNLNHVLIIKNDITTVLHKLTDNLITRFYILFSDPWPKKRHHKRRLLQQDFIALLAQKMCRHGILHIATDASFYAEQIKEILEASPDFSFDHVQTSWRPHTKYEARGIRLGHTINDFVVTKRHT